MAWQVLAMWAIVIVTITWFVRDEKRVRREAAVAEAARYYAHAPKYRHLRTDEPDPIAEPARRVGGLTPSQRDYLQALVKSN